tara:strand:+ start:547 stop:1023 length:477 start_codon:yes stop_codon:yes gene_type:complete
MPNVWTPPAKQEAIVIAKASGVSTKDCAKAYQVSESTVDRIVRNLKKVNPMAAEHVSTAHSLPSLEKLKASLLVNSHVAIDRSVRDTGEVHKAASTGLAYLKGIGEHSSGERTADVNVNVLVANVPAGFDELMQRHNMADDDVTDAQAVDSTGESGSP